MNFDNIQLAELIVLIWLFAMSVMLIGYALSQLGRALAGYVTGIFKNRRQ